MLQAKHTLRSLAAHTLFPGRIIECDINLHLSKRLVVIARRITLNGIWINCIPYLDTTAQNRLTSLNKRWVQRRSMEDKFNESDMKAEKDETLPLDEFQTSPFRCEVMLTSIDSERMFANAIYVNEKIFSKHVSHLFALKQIIPFSTFHYDEVAWITFRLAHLSQQLPSIGIGPMAIIANCLGFSFSAMINAMQRTSKSFLPKMINNYRNCYFPPFLFASPPQSPPQSPSQSPPQSPSSPLDSVNDFSWNENESHDICSGWDY